MSMPGPESKPSYGKTAVRRTARPLGDPGEEGPRPRRYGDPLTVASGMLGCLWDPRWELLKALLPPPQEARVF